MKPGAGDDLLDEDSSGEGEDSEADGETQFRLPWKHRRDTVKSDRPEIIQLHARKETVAGEGDLQDDVEDILGEDVYALDLREAAYLVAMQHPDEVAAKLREWGYDFE